jgi:hypothetical protein
MTATITPEEIRTHIDEVVIVSPEFGDGSESELEQNGGEFPSMPKLHIADFMPGTRFKVKFTGYNGKVLEATENGDGVRAIEVGNPNSVFYFGRPAIDFYSRRNLLEITKFSF